MTSNGEFNGLDIDEISSERIKTGLIKAVKKRLNSDNVEICIEHGSKKVLYAGRISGTKLITYERYGGGDNFIGEIYRILYKDANDSANSKQSSLILKIAPRNLLRREKMRLRALFLREINMYDQVLSYFDEFQRLKGINVEEDGFNECPKCYFSISEELSESLFLEDLRRRKFEMINQREEPITFDHMSLVLKALGKFHALSFAIKDQQPEKFNELSSLAFEQYWTMFSDTDFGYYYKSLLKRFTSILEEEKRFDLIEKFQKVVGDDFAETILRLVSSKTVEPYAVICHGDLTVNNTMYSKDEQGKPTGIQLFDWQFTRYGSPVIDLVLYLFCHTTKELRDEHYDEFLKIYYDSLSDLLKRLGSDPEKVFSYGALLDQFHKIGVYGAFVGVLLLPLLCAEVDSMPDFDEIAATENITENLEGFNDESVLRIADKSKQAYNKRVTDIFSDMARLGYI